MTNWYEALGAINTDSLKWPYPIKYGEETEIETDVLVLN